MESSVAGAELARLGLQGTEHIDLSQNFHENIVFHVYTCFLIIKVLKSF